MSWTVQVVVALLNIVWIFLFLQPEPFSVLVQRRSADSSDEETLFQEFCVEPQSHVDWTSTVHSITLMASNNTNNTNATSEVMKESNLTLDESQSVTKSHIQPKDLHSSQSSEMDDGPPASEFEPQTIDLDGTTPASPPAQRPTSSEVDAASGLISTISSEAARVIHRSKAPVQQEDNQDIRVVKPYDWNQCCSQVYRRRIRWNLIKECLIITNPLCPMTAIVLVTVKNRRVCVSPKDVWVRNVMKKLQKKLSDAN